jgi:hypothetical protein
MFSNLLLPFCDLFVSRIFAANSAHFQ